MRFDSRLRWAAQKSGTRLSAYDSLTWMTVNAKASSGTPRHFLILDALRFVFAFWVLMGHTGVPPVFAGADLANPVVRIIVHGYGTLVYGMTAVICFFVISGFCIHLPFRAGQKLPVGRFYARRYIRILIPVFAGIVVYRASGDYMPLYGPQSGWWNSVLWSLLCEEIYYAVYPLLLWVRRRVAWVWLLAPAIVASFTITLTHVHLVNWYAYGPILTSIVLYPVWLLGCVLAEQSDHLPEFTSKFVLIRWRLAAWLCAWICAVLNFKGHIHFTQSMMLFGVVAFFWIRKELAFRPIGNEPGRITLLLAAGGAWSYSLYMMHIPVHTLFLKLPLPSFGPLINWAVSTGFILGCSYIFYLVVERPSHRLARRVGSLEQKSARTAPLERTPDESIPSV
jgi:peptidoglycan/LPS O-acetylase OafA/YrhL